ncbi:hypothetical protein ACA910_014115 [Epithemia clementina (nom. ined.)]
MASVAQNASSRSSLVVYEQAPGESSLCSSDHRQTDDDDDENNNSGLEPVNGRDGLFVIGNSQQATKTMEKTPMPPFIIKVSAIAGLGGILFGYDLGVVSTALPLLTEYFALSKTKEEWVVSILYVGGFLGAVLGGYMCDSLGRKTSILITDVVFILGAFILFLAPTYAIVVLGRVVVGFAVAVSGIADVCYLHEIAPLEWRGSIVSVNEACISLGFLISFAVGGVLSQGDNMDTWRIMFLLGGVIALIQFLGMWDMPESPIWLSECGRHDESQAALSRILAASSADSANVTTETSRLSSCSTPINNPSGDEADTTDGIFMPPEKSDPAIMSLPPARYRREGDMLYFVQKLVAEVVSFVKISLTIYSRQAWIALFLAVTQQLCGQTSVLSFAPQIFASVSSGDCNASSFVRGWTTVSIGFVKFLITVLVIWKIEAFGRRPLLLSGIAAIAFGLLMLILASGVPGSAIKRSKFQSDASNNGCAADNSDNSNGFFFAFTGVMMVVCGYSMSFGPLTWLLTSELFPTDIRGRALGASTIINFGAAVLVTSTFLSMQSAMGNTALFGCYLCVSILGFVFALTAVPETKEKSVEEINEVLASMLWWR